MVLIQGNGASAGLKSRLVPILALVQSGIEAFVDRHLLLAVVYALYTEGFKQKGFGFLEHLFPPLTSLDVIGHHYRSGLGAPDAEGVERRGKGEERHCHEERKEGGGVNGA